MSYRTRILPPAVRQISSWGLSSTMLVEVYLRLREHLPDRPSTRLAPTSEADGGMLFPFEMVDPENRFCRHTFVFRVYYHSDEVTLIVASGIYRRDVEA